MISPVETWVAERTVLRRNLNIDTLRLWQHEKLQSVIQFAGKNSKFYHGKLPVNADLTELPFTYPSDITNDPLAFLAVPQSEVARVTTLENSGTTRKQKRIFFTEGDLERTVDFFAVGMSSLICKGDHAQILISSDSKNSLASLLKEALSRIGGTSGVTTDIKSASTAIEASHNADCLIGMPSEILYMSRIEPELRPKSVLLTADIVPQCVIDSIKETWKCNVFTHYGHTEFGFGCAVECGQHDGHHLRDADLIFEIVNPTTGKTVPQGVLGEIVITTLSNEAMPLIRYRTGNISRIINKPCGCGGMLSRLGRIEGRIINNIPLGESETLSIHQLDELIFSEQNVRGYDAMIKKEGKSNTLHLTVDSDGYLDMTSIIPKLPDGLNVDVMFGKADPFSKRGKRRIAII
jgi:phenylacetate-coenzyme A ligase PaaK-like adenylate-forming protein